MTKLSRFPIKLVRDYIKKNYKQRDQCYVCASTETLELHHLYSVSELFSNWCVANGILHIVSDEQMKELRVKFADDCKEELDNINLVTLCSKHHKQLHTVYGQTYTNNLVPKIKNWLEIQKAKYGD